MPIHFAASTIYLWHVSEDGRMVLQVHLNSGFGLASAEKSGVYTA